MPAEKKALFELTASELQDELSAMFKPFSGSHPIRCEVGAALLAAKAATQRLALRALDAVSAGGAAADNSHEELVKTFEQVEALNEYLLEGQPSRIDQMLWDAAGYIRGWFVDQNGRIDARLGSCPEVVATLAGAPWTLATYAQDWQVPLEQYATRLASLVRLAREKAELEARGHVESQGWLKRLASRTSLERELISLGFR
jgi:hypothetical protein